MNCKRTEELIPLYVGRELDSETTASIRSHLNSCTGCALLAAEFEESRKWLGGVAPEFEEALLADVKRGVMREIGALRTRPGFREWLSEAIGGRILARPLLASAAVLLVLSVIALWLYAARPGPRPGDKVAEVDSKPPASTATGADKQNNESQPDDGKHHRHRRFHVRNDRSREKEEIGLAPEVAKSDSPEVSAPVLDLQSDSERMLRIEIQTSDPNIRIIWFAPKETDSQQTRPVTDF